MLDRDFSKPARHDAVACKIYERRGLVIVAKYIGLESFRVRNCDPDADNRLPLDRASRCGNGDDSLDDRRQDSCFVGYYGISPYPSRQQSARLHLSGWPQVISHDFVRELSSSEGVEPSECLENAKAFFQGPLGLGGSAERRFADRSRSCSRANGGTSVTRPTVHPSGLIRASNRLVSTFVEFKSSPWSNSHLASPTNEVSVRVDWEAIRIAPGANDSKAGLRTHSLKKVSDEKRNADERPPSRGKPYRHR